MRTKEENQSLTIAMAGRYAPYNLRQVFNKSLWLRANGSRTSPGGIKQPYFYESDHATVFPPVTDKENHKCETIEEMLTHTCEKGVTLDKTKRMVFAVSEEQGLLPRNHWVTLIYEPTTRKATLIDSRPQLYGFWYNTTPMKESLKNGLGAIGLSLKAFDIIYQEIQYDDIHCGAWTALNIEAFANGQSIEEHTSSLRSEHKQSVVDHFIDLVFNGKKHTYRSYHETATPETDSNSSSSDDDFVLVDSDCFSQDDKKVWIETAIDLFKNCFSQRRALDAALIRRKNITFNGKILSDESLGAIDLQQLLTDIDNKYTFSTLVFPKITDGYGVRNPQYSIKKLRRIGLTDDEIRTMRFSDIILYDAVLTRAIDNAGHDTAYAKIQKRNDEGLLNKATDELNDFRNVLNATLREAVKGHQELKKAQEHRDSFQATLEALSSGVHQTKIMPVEVLEIGESTDTDSIVSSLSSDESSETRGLDSSHHEEPATTASDGNIPIVSGLNELELGNESDRSIPNATPLVNGESDTPVETEESEQRTVELGNESDRSIPHAPLLVNGESDTPVEPGMLMPHDELEPTEQLDHSVNSHFQMQCIQALLITTGCALLVLAILTCPPIAGVLGIVGAISMTTSLGAAGLGSLSLLVGVGLFAKRRFQDTTDTASVEDNVVFP